ncbi:NUDIX domain-containing protein [Paenibacillus urinalis]|uniref:NUDIX domain-containing protein n=1 Tax=Paenibacillus urinalis TaxID=521520 RepID=A0AAX3N3Z1_9BACL|nr:NUDIX domain-containing protein [Paenibacillus urinalis]WDH84106.1 NUDIX domain-containing protein [Paenibacillus urinalis]WDH95549.1 NUDIX domain-containing protein [Paenibacillus urinalis]WDI03746.1 NUDIX domain-containing protein [Paenibacillus urinalis]
MMISYEHESIQYHTTTGGIIIHEGKVLLQRERNQPYWFLPGGSVEAEDSPEYTIGKMIYDWLGVPVISEQQVWLIENVIELPISPTIQIHESGMFFLLELPLKHPIFKKTCEFAGANKDYVYKWIPLDELERHWVVPEFVVPELKDINTANGIKHIVS